MFIKLYYGDIHLHKVSRKYLERFQVIEWTQIYYRNHFVQSSKGHNSKSGLTGVSVLVFYTLSHSALHLYEVSLKYLERFFNLQSGHEYIVEMAIFNIYYVQRATTPKVG